MLTTSSQPILHDIHQHAEESATLRNTHAERVAAPQFLQGTIKNLLGSSHPFQRQVGIAAYAMHQVDSGAAVADAEHLCLLQPGTLLFPTSAPAWRQARWFSKME